jgi:hypothetical protein
MCRILDTNKWSELDKYLKIHSGETGYFFWQVNRGFCKNDILDWVFWKDLLVFADKLI